MTPEERDLSLKILQEAIKIANKIGPMIIKESDGDVPVTTTAAAIMLSSFCVAAGMTMHDTVDLVMSTYKQTLEFELESDK